MHIFLFTCLGIGLASSSQHVSPDSLALSWSGSVLDSPLASPSSRLVSVLDTSPTGSPNVPLSALHVVIDLLKFALQQVSDSGAPSSPHLTSRQHTRVFQL